MNNKQLLQEVLNLKGFIEIKERISEMTVGQELDEAFAIEFLDMEYVEETQEVEISSSNKLETNYVSTETEKPVFLPNVSTDNNLAVMVLKDLQQDFNFEYRENKFNVPYSDMAVFEGHTIGEAVMKALLFGRAIEAAGIKQDINKGSNVDNA